MKRKLMNSFPKEMVYELYVRHVDIIKDYQKITRVQMFEAVQKEFLEHESQAIEILLLSNFKRLYNIATQDDTYVKVDDLYFGKEPQLIDMIYVEDVKYEDETYFYKLNDELKAILRHEKLDSRILRQKEYEALILGAVDIYGELKMSDVEEMVFEILDGKVNFDFDVESSEQFFDQLELKGYLFDGFTLVHPRFMIEDDIPEPKAIYDKELYLEFALYGLPLHAIENHKLLKETTYQIQDFRDISNIFHDLIQMYEQPYLFFQALLAKEIDTYTEILLNWPVWRWGGMNFISYNETQLEEVLYKPDQFMDYLKLFVDVSLRENGVNIYQDEIDDHMIFNALKETLLDKERFDLAYKELHTLESKDVNEILNGFQNIQIIEDGIALEIIDGKLLVYSDHRIYYVTSPALLLDDVLDHRKFPLKVSLILIPFKDNITYFFDIIESESVDDYDELLELLKQSRHIEKYDDMSYKSLN